MAKKSKLTKSEAALASVMEETRAERGILITQKKNAKDSTLNIIVHCLDKGEEKVIMTGCRGMFSLLGLEPLVMEQLGKLSVKINKELNKKFVKPVKKKKAAIHK